MRIHLTILIALPLLFLLPYCDFPSDPPLKTVDTPVDNPPDDRVRPKNLLPLHPQNAWVFGAKPRFRPASNPMWVSPRELSFRTQTFYHLRYGIEIPGPTADLQAFPSLLRNDSTGLNFFLPVNTNDTLIITQQPKYMYTLPYPARVGTIDSNGTSDYRVRLTHVDTLITMFATSIMLPCHRYEVWHRQRIKTVFYIVPGICFLRIEDEEANYFTFGWRLKR